MNAALANVPKARRRVWAMAAGAVLIQILLLGLVVALLDLFAHDLLCRYGQSRWDPFDRACFVPTALEERP